MASQPPTFTEKPDPPAPHLLCPECDRPLFYRQTVLAGVAPLERWDYYECRRCGPFQYRQRTRALRRTDLSAPAAVMQFQNPGEASSTIAAWTTCRECRQQSGRLMPANGLANALHYACDNCGYVWKAVAP